MLYIGQNTLIIFCLHGIIYNYMQKAFCKFIPNIYGAILNNIYFSALFCIGFALVVCLILTPISYVINSYFPFVLGKRRLK